MHNKYLALILVVIFAVFSEAQNVHYKLLDVDNIELDANTVSTTNTNGNLLLSPNGTGRIDLKNGLSTGYITAQSTVKLQNLAGSKALQTDASKNLTESSVTSTELGYLSGVTSAIQTQFNAISGGSAITALTGDVVAFGPGSTTATIGNSVVTKAKLANNIIADAQVQTGASIAFAKMATITAGNILLGNASSILTAQAVSGDVTITSGGTTAIGAAKVTSAMLANMAQSTVKGRSAGAITGVPVDLTNTELTAILNPFTATQKGVVTAPGTTAGKFLRDDNTFQTVTASGSGTGQKNYISNPDAETALTTGWATYADAAGTSPVDGTAGSPSITFAASTAATVLRGTNSFLETKGASNRQGDGVSYDFTIDAADKAKALTISFDYTVFSGTYADGDLKLFLYDVTNAVLIPVSGSSILKVATGIPYKQISTFQTNSNSTSYRFIIHTASTSASAYVVQFDNFILGPASMTTGPPMSDWTSYSLTITGTGSNPSLGAQVNNNAQWRRVGDSMEIRYIYQQSGAGTAGSGSYLFSLPTGYTVDTAKMPLNGSQATIVGGAIAGWASNEISALASLYDSTHIAIRTDSDTQNWAYIGSGLYDLSLASAYYSFNAFVPIVGWSSNTAMSNDTDTRVVDMSVGLTSNVGPIINSAIKFDTVLFDTHGGYSTSTGLYTIPVPGKYHVCAITQTTGGGSATTYIAKNGSNFIYLYATGISETRSGCVDVDLKASDTIGIFPDTSTSYLGNSPSANTFSIHRLSGPAQVAATESVNARYTNSATALVSGTLATVAYATKDFDTHIGYSTGTGAYTCPTSGKYQVNAGLAVTAATTAANQLIKLQLMKNGNVISGPVETYFTSSTSKPMAVSISDLLSCLAGDTFSVQTAVTGTTPSIASSTTSNYFSLSRTGN